MKKVALGFLLILATLGWMASPAAAVSGSDQAFLASLTPDPAPMAKPPAIHGKALCYAQASCGGGTYVSCYGYNSSVSCSAEDRNCDAGVRGSVKCDGVKTKCPTPCPPPQSPTCEELADQCVNTCGLCPIQSFNCEPYSCHCWLSPACL